MSDKIISRRGISRRRFTGLSLGLMMLPGAKLTQAGTQVETAGHNQEKKKMIVRTYNLPGARFFPESIGYQPSTGHFFVGSLENGEVVRGEVKTGKVTSYLAAGANGMTSAAGIKLDHHDHLYVAGGSTGLIFIYEAATARLLQTFQVSASPTVVNDFVSTGHGEVYVTDSLNPYLYKIWHDQQGQFHFDEHWLPLAGTPIQFVDGLNLNGITVTEDRRYLIVGQTNVGKIFRVEIATKEVKEIEVGGANLVHADGILLEGDKLYLALNAVNQIVTVQLSHDFLKGKVVATTTDPAFQFPTALAKAGHELLIVNGQLDKEAPGQTPVLPFTVVAVDLPLKNTSGH